MSASDVLAWLAVAVIPGTAAAGWLLRRWGSGPFAVRLRPHFILGYAGLGLAVVHMSLSMGATDGANPTGIWFASVGIAGLAVQAFIGTNLQSPGLYRPLLRRWHIVMFLAVAALIVGHVALNAAFLQN